MERRWIFICVIFVPVVLSLDFEGVRVPRSAQSVHMKAEGPFGSVLDVTDHHSIRKRSTTSCSALQRYEKKLTNNTHIVSSKVIYFIRQF